MLSPGRPGRSGRRAPAVLVAVAALGVAAGCDGTTRDTSTPVTTAPTVNIPVAAPAHGRILLQVTVPHYGTPDTGTQPPETAVWQVGRAQDGSATLTRVVPETVVDADVSPDGTTLAMVRGFKLVLYDLDATGAAGPGRELTFGDLTPSVTGCLTWSPDGQRLAFQDSAHELFVTDRAGHAVPVDRPKSEDYRRLASGAPILAEPTGPAQTVSTEVTCGRWLGPRRLVFQRVATMPSRVTESPGSGPIVLPADTTTIADLDGQVRLTDFPQQWWLVDSCGTRRLTTGTTRDGLGVHYLLDGDPTPATGGTPQAAALPEITPQRPVSAVLVPGSCQVVMVDTEAQPSGAPNRFGVRRLDPATRAVTDLPPVTLLASPALTPGHVTWDPSSDGARLVAVPRVDGGDAYLFDVTTGSAGYLPVRATDRGRDDVVRVLAWLP